jgi:hypothetical protein
VEYIVITTKNALIMMCSKTSYERDQEGKVTSRW